MLTQSLEDLQAKYDAAPQPRVNTRDTDPDLDEEIRTFPIVAAGNKVYIRVLEEETSGGGRILLPTGSAIARQTCRAVVIASGPGAAVEGPKGRWTALEPGDNIAFGQFSGREVKVLMKGKATTYAIMSELDALGWADQDKEQMTIAKSPVMGVGSNL